MLSTRVRDQLRGTGRRLERGTPDLWMPGANATLTFDIEFMSIP
jgi:hypothetical protein